MSKQDEIKAKEIAEYLNKPNGSNCLVPCHQAAMAMAEWKEQQMIEKAVEWIKINVCPNNKELQNIFIKSFKQTMAKE